MLSYAKQSSFNNETRSRIGSGDTIEGERANIDMTGLSAELSNL